MKTARTVGLGARSRRPEIMDRPGLDPRAHDGALRGLGRVNAVSRSASVLWGPVERLAREGGGPVRVLDVASGGGDNAIRLALLARRAGLDVRVEGSDVSPHAVAFATARARDRGADVRFFRWDALAEPTPAGNDYDVVTCSLFLHHLDDESAAALLRALAAAARRLLLVDDLVRSRFGYALAWVGCRVLSRSGVVRHDGPVSVASAFRPEELAALASRAGLTGVSLRRHWPERVLLTWRPS